MCPIGPEWQRSEAALEPRSLSFDIELIVTNDELDFQVRILSFKFIKTIHTTKAFFSSLT